MTLQIVCVTLIFLLMFPLIRGSIGMYIEKKINRSNRKKRTKNQTFADWFFYRKFRDVLPKSKLVLYFLHIVLYPTLLLVTVVLGLLDVPLQIGTVLVEAYLGVALVSTYMASK